MPLGEDGSDEGVIERTVLLESNGNGRVTTKLCVHQRCAMRAPPAQPGLSDCRRHAGWLHVWACGSVCRSRANTKGKRTSSASNRRVSISAMSTEQRERITNMYEQAIKLSSENVRAVRDGLHGADELSFCVCGCWLRVNGPGNARWRIR
jgi:hypothetical protein